MFIRIIDVGCGWGVIHGQKSHFTEKRKKSINEIQDHRLDWTNRSGHAHRSLFVQHRTMSVSTISNRRHGSNRFELCNQLRLHWNALERKDRPVSWRVVGNGRLVTIYWGILCTGDESSSHHSHYRHLNFNSGFPIIGNVKLEWAQQHRHKPSLSVSIVSVGGCSRLFLLFI